jgi:integrase
MLLSTLWIFAKEHLAMRLGPNPTTDIPRLHRRSWEHEPWPDEVIERFEAKARPRPNAPLALLLLLYTGQRLGDVAAMTWDRYDGVGITVRQQKTDALLWIKCHRRLREALDHHQRRSAFILTTQRGSGYNAGALGNMIKDALVGIGRGEYSGHGLRKNAAKALAEAGCTVHEIMAITGHASMRLAMHYAKGAAQRQLATDAIGKLEKAASSGKHANHRRTQIGKPY